jgi:DeoR/GlpR family transcriptional regulator of sugar metabolism
MIADGEAVMLDSGTTTFHLARHLIGRSLQVVTNSLPVAQLLGGSPQVELTFIGGYVYPRTGATMGPLAEETLKRVHVSKFFCGAAGITERGLFAVNMMLAEVDRRMIERSDEVIILADHTKFGKSAVAPLCELNAAHRLICDDGLTAEWQSAVRGAGVELILAKIDSDDRAERGERP